MKKFLIYISLLFLLTGCGSATVIGINKTKMSPKFDPATVNRVAIVDFSKNKNLNYDTAIIADKFTAELVGSEIFSLMDRNDIKKIMYEVGFQSKSSLAGILNDATLQRLSAMGADSILTGNLVSFNQVDRNGTTVVAEAHLIAKMLKIESGEVIWSAEMQKKSKSKDGKDAQSAEIMLSDIIAEMSIPLNTADKFKRLFKKAF
ncbi:MAG: hypothetical protein C0603_12250 [Denitrovibrio sp.]|nr:MAG: hypothetical protein C0603_12250 [Denitrovibrio sp.]